MSFSKTAFKQFTSWASEDKKIYKKMIELIKDIERNPFQGIGKPEPLKHNLSGYWSRRIDDTHRLIYRVKDDQIFIISCKWHYKKAD